MCGYLRIDNRFKKEIKGKYSKERMEEVEEKRWR
jgi:hypothetical protein